MQFCDSESSRNQFVSSHVIYKKNFNSSQFNSTKIFRFTDQNETTPPTKNNWRLNIDLKIWLRAKIIPYFSYIESEPREVTLGQRLETSQAIRRRDSSHHNKGSS